MSRQIKLEGEQLEKIVMGFLSDIEKKVGTTNTLDSKLSFSLSMPETNKKADLIFDPVAFIKMWSLVHNYDTEVAWHGTVERVGLNYLVKDILVYPQEVSGGTVNTEQEKYEKWLYELDDDTFNGIRFQGHSHVNMGTSPSSVDSTHQEAICNQLKGGDFYIFAILNKKGDMYIKIVDLRENTLYETRDITVKVGGKVVDIKSFIKDAHSLTCGRVERREYLPHFESYHIYDPEMEVSEWI